MHMRANREIIHRCLADGHTAVLLVAAVRQGGAAQRDADVLRALMQLALEQGDIETVRGAARRMVDVGVALGHLLLCLEGICLLRNVAGEADADITRVLDALDQRGFDAERIAEYAAWKPAVATIEATNNECPAPADALRLLSEDPLPDDAPGFAWTTLWPQLDRATRRLLIDNIHFELRNADESALVPPRLMAAWVTSGEIQTVDAQRELVPPGTMLAPIDDAPILAGIHLRLVGLREERWAFMLAQPSFAAAWQNLHMRTQAYHAMQRVSEQTPIHPEVIEALLLKATITHPGGTSGSDAQHRVLLVIDGLMTVPPSAQTSNAAGSSYGPGTLLSLPPGTSIEPITARVLRWSAGHFEQLLPLSGLHAIEVEA